MVSTPNAGPGGAPSGAPNGAPGGAPDAWLEDDEDDAPGGRLLVASLGGAWLAVAAEDVRAVVRAAPVTPLGGTAPWVAGVAAVRGQVVPVVDAGRLAGAPEGAGGDAWWVVVADAGRAVAVAGLRVHRVVPGATAEVGDAAPGVPGLPARGVARLDGETRGADALPPAARLLDAGALLDLVHDPTGG